MFFHPYAVSKEPKTIKIIIRINKNYKSFGEFYDICGIHNEKIIVVNFNDNIGDVIALFRKNKISGAPVVDNNGNVIGMISESDIIKTLTTHSGGINMVLPSPLDLIELPLKTTLKMEEFKEDMERALKIKVIDIMTKNVISIPPNTSINDAAKIMVENNIKSYQFIENGKLVGIITREDLIEILCSS